MKTILIAVLLATAPALAHDHHQEPAKKGAPADAPISFEKQPAQGTWAKCPVSGDVFRVDADTEFYTWQGRVYAFCCPDCKPDFVQNPGKYATRK
jgi:YHS domain-containing protein